MPRKRSPKRDLAHRLWLDSGKTKKLKDIAAELGVSESQIRKWKNQDEWNGNVTNQAKGNVTKPNPTEKTKKQETAEQVEQVLGNQELNDKQRLFCLYYAKSFNATRAYLKAYPGCGYNTATVKSCQLMKDERIRKEIFQLKQAKMNKAMLETEDVFQKYIDIAFSDIADFVEFGREEVQVMGAFGPIEKLDEETGERVPVTKTINSVRFRESSEVDGSLISEVSQGKDGAKIKLLDKMKALDWLTAHMDLATEEQRAKVEKLKAETAKIKGEDADDGGLDDGFLEALKGEAADSWEDE